MLCKLRDSLLDVCVGGLEQKGGKKKKLAGKKVFGALDKLDTFICELCEKESGSTSVDGS